MLTLWGCFLAIILSYNISLLPLSFLLPCDEMYTSFELARQDLETDYENLGRNKRILMYQLNVSIKLLMLMCTFQMGGSCHLINLPYDSRLWVAGGNDNGPN